MEGVDAALTHEITRQFHSHEHSGHEKAQQHADKADEKQKETVQFGNVRSIGTIQDYEAEASHSEKKAGGKSLHDVLSIHPVSQKCHWSLMSVLICH